MTDSHRYVLCAGVDEADGSALSSRLARAGVRLEFVRTAADFLLMARSVRFDLFVLAGEFTGGGGAELYGQIRRLAPRVPVIFFSDEGRGADCRRELPAAERAYFINQDIDGLVKTLTGLLG
jgi:DNA-binding response OmpR family regulator